MRTPSHGMPSSRPRSPPGGTSARSSPRCSCTPACCTLVATCCSSGSSATTSRIGSGKSSSWSSTLYRGSPAACCRSSSTRPRPCRCWARAARYPASWRRTSSISRARVLTFILPLSFVSLWAYTFLCDSISRARVLTFIVPFFFVTLTAYLFIGYWIALNALQAFLNIGVSGGGVAFFAHIGGFVSGLVLALLLRPRNHPDPHPGYPGYV